MTTTQIPDREYVMGMLIVVHNKLQMLLDREFAPFDVTAKQWYMLVVLASMFSEPPTLGQAAKVMEMSHQNVKQIAIKLEQKGFLEIWPDESDGRAIRLRMTDQCAALWENLAQPGELFLQQMYDGFSAEGLMSVREALDKLINNLQRLEEREGDKQS